MKKNSTTTAVLGLLAVGAVAVPLVVWGLYKLAQVKVVASILENLK